MLAEPEQVKGIDFDASTCSGSHAGRSLAAPSEPRIPGGCSRASGRRPRTSPIVAPVAGIWRQAGRGAGSSSPIRARCAAPPAPPRRSTKRATLDGAEEAHEEELFGPAEGLHATYRMLRDEVLEASWRAGAALSEMRLDTAEDVNRAVARYFELLKLAALIQRPGSESERDAIAALNELIGRIATPEQLAELDRSALDEYVLDEGRDRTRRSEELASRASRLEAFLPKRGGGLALSASDVDLYLTCPLKYKFARVFAIPQEPTINQRFGILIHNVLERYHADEIRDVDAAGGDDGGLNRLLGLFEAGWRRTGFGFSDDELQYRDRAVAALARYHERHSAGAALPVWLERRFSFKIGETTIGGRVDRVDRHPDGSYELIDYKTGPPKAAADLTDDLQIALYRVAARKAWDIEAADGSYWYVLDDEKVPRRRRARRPRARRAHRRRGGRRHHRPGLRAAPVVRGLLAGATSDSSARPAKPDGPSCAPDQADAAVRLGDDADARRVGLRLELRRLRNCRVLADRHHVPVADAADRLGAVHRDYLVLLDRDRRRVLRLEPTADCGLGGHQQPGAGTPPAGAPLTLVADPAAGRVLVDVLAEVVDAAAPVLGEVVDRLLDPAIAAQVADGVADHRGANGAPVEVDDPRPIHQDPDDPQPLAAVVAAQDAAVEVGDRQEPVRDRRRAAPEPSAGGRAGGGGGKRDDDQRDHRPRPDRSRCSHLCPLPIAGRAIAALRSHRGGGR